jgi:hypothetical protein
VSPWADRYHVQPVGIWWGVFTGNGTRPNGRFLCRRSADRFAAELLTAFMDGKYVAETFMNARPDTAMAREEGK